MDAAEQFVRDVLGRVAVAKGEVLPGAPVDMLGILRAAFQAHHGLTPASGGGTLWGDTKIIPPQPEWVTAYSASIAYPLEGQKWCDQYAAKGWVVGGRAKMKDWQAAVRNWKNNGWTIKGGGGARPAMR